MPHRGWANDLSRLTGDGSEKDWFVGLENILEIYQKVVEFG